MLECPDIGVKDSHLIVNLSLSLPIRKMVQRQTCRSAARLGPTLSISSSCSRGRRRRDSPGSWQSASSTWGCDRVHPGWGVASGDQPTIALSGIGWVWLPAPLSRGAGCHLCWLLLQSHSGRCLRWKSKPLATNVRAHGVWQGRPWQRR